MPIRFIGRVKAALLAVFLFIPASGHAIPWFPFGPDGGDARSFAADPHDHAHLYLGTVSGWIYESHDEGTTWKRLARLGHRDDLVLDNIAVDSQDSKHLVVASWVVDHPDGGLFVSHDGGLTWTMQPDLAGQSIRSLAESASNPKLWVAGTLTGIQRSEDNGDHWKPISPPGNTELHEVESVAIDPADPRVIYAGTWHLPWKTTDGGATWNNIKEGVIDDSDVFSIILDPTHPGTVYASACSGIYKSENGGTRFQKVEGIPSSARRTRVLMQDPRNRDVVFAGTTEGLFRTGDAGKIWIRMTGPDVIVNDVYIDPTDSNRILLATDRSGVLASTDGGSSFRSANTGFSARHLSGFVQDAHDPAIVYVGALNDKQWGGVFRSDNGGLTWQQRSDGLEGSDIFSLGQAPDTTLLAGTGHGIYRLTGYSWERIGAVAATAPAPPPARKSAHKSITPPHKAAITHPLDVAVYALAVTSDSVLAATGEGLLTGGKAGTVWRTVEAAGSDALYNLATAGREVAAANLTSIRISHDSGNTWKTAKPPSAITQLTAVSIEDTGILWAAGREGVFRSLDDGASWQPLPSLAINNVNSLFFDARGHQMLVTVSGKGTFAYTVHLPDMKASLIDTGWNLRFIRPVGDHLLGVTPFDGVVIQPRMVESAEFVHP